MQPKNTNSCHFPHSFSHSIDHLRRAPQPDVPAPRQDGHAPPGGVHVDRAAGVGDLDPVVAVARHVVVLVVILWILIVMGLTRSWWCYLLLGVLGILFEVGSKGAAVFAAAVHVKVLGEGLLEHIVFQIKLSSDARFDSNLVVQILLLQRPRELETEVSNPVCHCLFLVNCSQEKNLLLSLFLLFLLLLFLLLFSRH